MTYFESILKVLVVGLVLGAGLPAVFAGGLVAYSNGAGGTEADGTAHAPNPAMKYLGIAMFVFVGVGDHHRRRLDHQGDDHPPFRFRSVPVHAQEVSGDHMTETNTSPGVMDNVLGWLHQGYPEGVPQKDYFALLALAEAEPHRGRGRQGRSAGPQGRRRPTR